MVYISGGNNLLDPTKILKRLGIKIGHKVADLGCGGSGHFIMPAAQLVGKQTTVYAVDILKSVLRSVVSMGRMEGINNIKPIWSNLEILKATKIKKASLDFIFLINILFQSKQRENIFQEAERLLKEEGKLLVIDWNHVPSTFGPPPDHRVTKKEIKSVVRKLKLIDEFDAGNYHFGLIFKK